MLDLIRAYENYLSKVKQASANTISSYMRDVRQFSDWLHSSCTVDLIDVEQSNISSYLRYLEEDGRSAATVSRTLASLKNFYAYVVSSGFLEKTPVTDIHINRGEKKLPQILTGREIELLLSQPVCVDAKGEVIFAYINTVLDNWHKIGYKTPSDIKKEVKEDKIQKSAYDLDLFEKMLNSKE